MLWEAVLGLPVIYITSAAEKMVLAIPDARRRERFRDSLHREAVAIARANHESLLTVGPVLVSDVAATCYLKRILTKEDVLLMEATQ